MEQFDKEGFDLRELSLELRKIVKAEISEFLRGNSVQFKPEYLTRNEVADLLRVDLSTLHHWKRKGILIPYGIGGRVLYKREDVEHTLLALK